MQKRINVFIIFIFTFLFFHKIIFALETDTHRAINLKIATYMMNGFSLNQHLKSNLGFSQGIDETLDGRRVDVWLELGGLYEDKPPLTIPYTRSMNHFHNPLKTWDISGFKGTFQSSVIWVQDQGTFGSLWGGDWSWKKARTSFYKGLTGAIKADRDTNFADTFRSLGQVMHLVQDVSVPSHTRDDAHIIGLHYELAVDELRKMDDSIFLDAVSNPITFDPSVLTLIPNPLALIPIAKIFDTDKYYNTDPDPNVTTGNTSGLSEYTNANFVSEGLISANFQDFPYPRIQDTSIIEKSITGPSGTYTRQYYLKNCCGETNAGQGYLLSVVDYLDYWRQQYPLLSIGLPKIPVLDNNVYRDYASLLIPRAVGYSAGLLNYFFRGNIEISAPDSYVYSITDGAITPHQFTYIKANVRNTKLNEEIQNGILQAVVRYKKRIDYQPDLSTDPPTAESREPDFSYSVSAPINLTTDDITALNSSAGKDFTFDFTGSYIPAGITDLYLQVVFKGTLGNETDIAVAVGMKDLMEPTHHVFWNLTDMFSLNYHLYTSDQIKSDTNLASLVDLNHNGIFNELGEPYIDPYDISFEFAYIGESPPSSQVSPLAKVNLPAGRFARLLVLVDRPANNFLRVTVFDKVDNISKYGDFSFEGVINQEISGVWQPPTAVTTFRSIKQHFQTGMLRCEPSAIDPVTGDKFCPYPEEEAIPVADLTPYPVTIYFPEAILMTEPLDYQQALHIQMGVDTGIGQGEGLMFIKE